MNSIFGNNETICRAADGGAAVCGVGISNLPLIEFLLKHAPGIKITARDKKSREQLGEVADTLEGYGVELILGDGYLENLCESVIFRTPGIRPDTPELAMAAARGALITSEMELFWS